MSESESSNNIINPTVTINENNTTISTYRQKCLNISHKCGDHILSIIYRFLSDCLICRFISFIFTLQAGIMWLGCK